MNKTLYTTLICSVLFCMSSCRKYVEIPPQNTKVLETTTDYQQLLYYGTLFDPSYYYPVFSGDDAGSDDTKWQTPLNLIAASAYTWADRFYGQTQEDADWDKLYQQMYTCNTVISGVMKSEGGTDAQKQGIMASALVQRAYIYYTLVNLYAKQYDTGTAATDPGVPLVLSTLFFTDLTRASVQKVYDQIKADLNQAIPNLPDLPDVNSNPSKAAAYAIMARVCLNTREFTEAEKYADLTLALKSTLIDLSLYKAAPTTLPTRVVNPEVIFFKKTSQFPTTLPLTASALSVYDPNDLRYQIYTKDASTVLGATFTGRTFYLARLTSDGAHVGPEVPEIMLIKAECEARANNPAAAVSVLNDLRKKRFEAVNYKALSAADGNTALHLVIDERRRELIGRGFRWFDQRRLSKDAGFVTTVTRVFKGVTYTLEPGGNRYTYAIGDVYITLNPEITQNPR